MLRLARVAARSVVVTARQSRSFRSSPLLLEKLFDKILVANRGEIACRVFQTAQKLGIKTVAVYSEPDLFAKHVSMADEAVLIGPAASKDSYLRIDKVVDAIKSTGAQAVHPGYGFLSENSDFVAALEKAGITFIGPPASAIQAMGDKIESKKIAKEAGVNVIPGYLGEVKDVEEAVKIARDVGYPVMLKASAGGGGKGMRIAWNDDETREGYRLAKQEAASSFGDDRLLIERYIDNPRHIEIQVICDKHGNRLYLNERECSIQRRNQKVVEEAPSPFLTPEVRKAMGEQAVALCARVGYVSAGTVEFLVDSQRNFYFLEMNTRLQVEHPITEKITGLDIVELMIRVAAGQKLPLTQSEVPILGWAIESRVYAEDPLRGFLPSIGRLIRYREPVDEELGIRVDSGVLEGSEISMYYDPLISKLITHGSSREEAIMKMKDALDNYIIRGVNHNVNFLYDVMDNKRFQEGKITTKFIPEEYPQGFHGRILKPEERFHLVTLFGLIHHLRYLRSQTINPIGVSPYSIYIVRFDGKDYQIGVDGTNSPRFDVYLMEGETKRTFLVDISLDPEEVSDPFGPVFYAILQDADLPPKKRQTIPIATQVIAPLDLGYRLQFLGTAFEAQVLTPDEAVLFPFMKEPPKKDTFNVLAAPMAGNLVSVAVKEGQKVVAGAELCCLEAMKMQNILRAPRDVVIKKILCEVGKPLTLDQVIIEFEAA